MQTFTVSAAQGGGLTTVTTTVPLSTSLSVQTITYTIPAQQPVITQITYSTLTLTNTIYGTKTSSNAALGSAGSVTYPVSISLAFSTLKYTIIGVQSPVTQSVVSVPSSATTAAGVVYVSYGSGNATAIAATGTAPAKVGSTSTGNSGFNIQVGGKAAVASASPSVAMFKGGAGRMSVAGGSGTVVGVVVGMCGVAFVL